MPAPSEAAVPRRSALFTRVGLVGCASAKLSRPAPARALYTSALFRKASAYVEATCDVWFVLSAKHGLVHPDETLEPYDVKLGRGHRDPAKDAPPIWDWATAVTQQLEDVLRDVEDPMLVVLAGEQYRTVLHHTDYPYELPMRGLGIGEQLAWLTTRNAALALSSTS